MPCSPPRDPGDIDGLTVWLEADRGVVRDSSGNVSGWRDQSGRGNHAVQGTAGARPTYARDANGRWVVQTTRAARYMQIPATEDTGPGPLGFTIYAAYASTDAATYGAVAGKWSTVAAEESWIQMSNDVSHLTYVGYLSESGTNTDKGAFPGVDVSVGAPVCSVLRHDPAGFVRASLASIAAVATAIAAAKAAATTPMSIGRASATQYPITADIAALVVVRRYIAHNSAEDVFLRDYLRRTTGAP